MATISNKVRYYTSAMSGAPVLSGTAGALIAVLDACLVSGFGNKSIDSLVVSGGIATANIGSGHDFAEGDVLRISGATPAGLNSDWRLASVTATSVTWSVEGCGIADGTATGTITTLRAPAGWEKVFSDGGNRAAYRSLRHAEHFGQVLYVDDTGASTARVIGYSSMASIDAGSNPFPTADQLSGGGHWGKSQTADATARPWRLVADHQRVIFCPANTALNSRAFHFGRLSGAGSTDANACLLSIAVSTVPMSPNIGGASNGDLVAASNANVGYLSGSTISAGSLPANAKFPASSLSNFSGSSVYPAGILPEGVNALLPTAIFDETGAFRGYVCGALYNYARYTIAATPEGAATGPAGNGIKLLYNNTAAIQNSFFLNLGTNGRWD